MSENDNLECSCKGELITCESCKETICKYCFYALGHDKEYCVDENDEE